MTFHPVRLIVILSFATLAMSACNAPAATPASSTPAPLVAIAAASPLPPTNTAIPSTSTPTETATATRTAVPTRTLAPSDTPTASPTATFTPTLTSTATRVPTRRPTLPPTIALKCPPLPPYTGQNLPFDPPLPLPLSKSGYGEFGAIVFHNSTNERLNVQVVAGIVTNYVDLPAGTEFSAVVLPGQQQVQVDYPKPGGTKCTYQVTADQVLFMQIGP